MHHPGLLPLFDTDPARRRSAIDGMEDTLARQTAGLYSLRQALLTDADATVRATAADTLGRIASGCTMVEQERMAGWLEDAARDGHASVREAAYRALTRVRTSKPPSDELRRVCSWLEQACQHEPVWSVRRSAALALTALAGARATPALLATLDDPFWRVRHAAISALAALASQDATVRDAVLNARLRDPGGPAAWAIEYLRRGLHGQPLPPLEPEPRPESGLAYQATPAWDPDPAVMTARFEDPQIAVPRALLLEAVADAHEPLRQAAASRLLACKDLRTYRAALLWLDERRIPHAAQTVCSVLDQLGDTAAELAAEVLGHGDATEHDDRHAGHDGHDRHDGHDGHDGHAGYGPGARVWALSWVARTRSHALLGAVLAHARPGSEDGGDHDDDAEVRAAALETLACLAASWFDVDGADSPSMNEVIDALGRGTGAAAAVVRLAAVRGLCELRTPRAYEAIACMAYEDQALAVRRALVSAAVNHGDVDRLRRVATREGDAWCQSQALAALDGLGELDAMTRARAANHEDPWLRAAALDDAGALAALGLDGDEAGEGDADPLVRRAAIEQVMARCQEPAARARVGLRCAADRDPWMRGRAAMLLDATRHDRELEALLVLSGDTTPMVRAAAADRLNACASLDDRLAALVARHDQGRGGQGGDHDDRARISAYTWLARRFDDHAAALVSQARTTERAAVQAHLDALALAMRRHAMPAPAMTATTTPASAPGMVAGAASAPGMAEARAADAIASTCLRPLGKSGIRVSPLAVSGVFELPAGSLIEAHRAGVNMLFWEPRYRAMTRFVRASHARRQHLVIAAGTFHASRAAIEADVDRALRRLRTDTIDVFLIFWVRSPARLSDEVRACLDGLRTRGKIRAAGFSTHDRDLAARTLREQDWDVVMVRHSAAHRGAEDSLLPVAREREVGVLTFSALCYGRMLRAAPGSEAPPSAADCYRYSLSQPGVSACISAPRRHGELVHNLAVLDTPTLDPDRVDALRRHGQEVHARNRDFNALIRREPARVAADALARGAQRSADADMLGDLLDDIAPPAHF